MSNNSSYVTEWNDAVCDKYDYMIAGFCGSIAGIIDVVFVGMPSDSKLVRLSDEAVDKIVKRFATLSGWSPRPGKEDSIASAIGFLEKNFKVNYDQRHSADVDNLFSMSLKNHHFKSLSHSPDPIGCFFSILDQFMNTSTFISDGTLIRVDTSNKESPLQGGNFIAKVFSGFINWLGHIMSDIAGSSGSRGGEGRGTGVPIPFMDLFQFCNFGSFQVGDDRQNFATVMVRVFQEGYDLRFAGAMAVPVLLEELMIRGIWALRRHFEKGYQWKDCIPSTAHGDLRIMLIVGNTVLCLFDITDATLRSGFGSNMVIFFLRLNYIAWVRLIILVFKELIKRYGPVVERALKRFLEEVMYNIKTESERRNIEDFYRRTKEFDGQLEKMYQEFVKEIENEYILIHKDIELTFYSNKQGSELISSSVSMARNCNVDESKIIHNIDELDDFFKNK